LKALAVDIRQKLEAALPEIGEVAAELGLSAPDVLVAVRTGDTAASERAAMLRRPPHFLITTPESLYLLVTAERSRTMLGGVRTVIVDEIRETWGRGTRCGSIGCAPRSRRWHRGPLRHQPAHPSWDSGSGDRRRADEAWSLAGATDGLDGLPVGEQDVVRGSKRLGEPEPVARGIGTVQVPQL
jgi:hypothetical protein